MSFLNGLALAKTAANGQPHLPAHLLTPSLDRLRGGEKNCHEPNQS
jgi:hypothetical protein